MQEKQRIAAAEGDDADVFGYHFENGMLAVNLFHMRGGRVLDRREFFWEDLPEFEQADENANEHVGTAALGCPAEQSSATEIRVHDSAKQGSAGQPRAAVPTSPNFDPRQFFSQFLTQLHPETVIICPSVSSEGGI